MQGLVITESGKLELKNQEHVSLEKHQLRVRVAVSAVCGSDLKLIKNPLRPGVQIPGHEFSGQVIESFTDKTFLGKRVTVFPMQSCLKCEHCKRREFRDCENKVSLGYAQQGTFAEEVIIDDRFAIQLHENLSYEEGALVEHLCCGFRLAIEVEKWLERDDSILILGDGPMALADIRFLVRNGYRKITLIGKHPERMIYARSLGAQRVVSHDEFLKSSEYNRFFDALIYTINREEFIDKIESSFKEGIRIFPQARISEPKMSSLVEKYKAKFGRAFAYHFDDFYEVMELIQSRKIDVSGMISAKINMSDVPEGLAVLFDKSNVKTLIVNENFQVNGDLHASVVKHS